jgi:general secretion pathway protein H
VARRTTDAAQSAGRLSIVLGTRGFTLVELLVVVVIVAVLAGALTLAVGSVGGERQLSRQAEQLRALVDYACEQSERMGRDIGISLDVHGYSFSFAGQSDWIPIQANELRPRAWLAGTVTSLQRDGQRVDVTERAPQKPQLVCFSSGELTPFRMELALADVPKQYRVEGEPDGNVRLSTVETRVR